MNQIKESFKSIVQECINEIKVEKQRRENVKKEKLREALRKYVKGLLKESFASPDAPEQDKEDAEKIEKGYAADGNKSSEVTQDQQVQELTKAVHSINNDFNVYRDTSGDNGKRNFIIVDAGDLFSVRIKERWDNNFDIEAFIHENDRIIALGLNWPQVKAFVKANFMEVNKTYVQKGMDKVDQNREDQTAKRDADLPDTSIKNRGEKNNGEDAKLKNTKKDDMDFKKDDVSKDEDKPSAPMKQVVKKATDSPETKNKAKDQKETDKVKPPKHKNDDELVKKMPGKKRD